MSKEGGPKARGKRLVDVQLDGQNRQMSDDVDRSLGADVGGSTSQESRCSETASP